MDIETLRREYHRKICADIVRMQRDGSTSYPNFADKGNKASRAIAQGIVDRLEYPIESSRLSGQSVGGRFESLTREFLESAFALLDHLRPGQWIYSTQMPISSFDQYEHLAGLTAIVRQNNELASALGTDYIVKPDIVVGRVPVSDQEINREHRVLGTSGDLPKFTPLRAVNYSEPRPILLASISCKWTLRSDRGQNARTEALNLIRNRKGHLPHIVSVTAEPLPTRIASLALGTGDLDCVYHFALPELQAAIEAIENEDQLDMLRILVEGRRLRDISDLPFDLAT